MGSSRKAGVNWRSTATIRDDEMPGHNYIVWFEGSAQGAMWLPETRAWLIGMHTLHRRRPSHFAVLQAPE